MNKLTEHDRNELIRLLQAGEQISTQWRGKLFPGGPQSVEIGKEYRLEYAGKMKREQVLAETPAAPWQLVRRFAEDRPHGDGWRNLLVWGDNLLALRELLADQQGANRYGTRGKIKLIYIDPPFATKQDFMKDREKAYRDKVLGAQFIEFLRRRLILLRELMADEGTIYVHLDWKKSHYIKAILDEVFGEENFLNNVVWCYKTRTFAKKYWNRKHDDILVYAKNIGEHVFKWNDKRVMESYSLGTIKKFKLHDENGWYRLCGRGIAGSPIRSAKDVEPKWELTHPHLVVRNYLGDGFAPNDYWNIEIVNQAANEREYYPTQKPEALLEKIIAASSSEGDIVLDCFAGSGTTPAVAEKLGRRWIAMDCGKLAVYTLQKRLFTLSSIIGATTKDERSEHTRIADWNNHLKSHSGLLLITEKAKKGECEVTLDLLADLAALISKHDLLKKGSSLSIACPEDKLHITPDRLNDADPDTGPGEKCITINGQEFRISLIAPKEKPEKEKPLPPKEFALYRAGLYDMEALRGMPWQDYRPFVLKLFGVREDIHTRYGMQLDGYIGTFSTILWNYPDHPTLTLDYGYVENLHQVLRGKKGERFYVIAPTVAMDFAEDEVEHGGAVYAFLKVPISVIMRLIQQREPGALKQPMREADVNEVIDAIGFDFISQPVVKHKSCKKTLELFPELVVELSEFRAKTLTTDPEDFANFETFSMAMVDLNYDGDVFRLDRVYWGEELLKEAGGLEKAETLEIRIQEQAFKGEKMMVILCDRYGNEKTLVFGKGDFQ
jgi:DNA modification methylase